MSVKNLDDKRPHILLWRTERKAYTVPVKLFKDFVSGKTNSTQIDGFDDIMRDVVREWLERSQ